MHSSPFLSLSLSLTNRTFDLNGLVDDDAVQFKQKSLSLNRAQNRPRKEKTTKRTISRKIVGAHCITLSPPA